MRTLLFVLIIFLPQFCNAAVYKNIDSSGNVTYSDSPADNNATPVIIPKTNTVPSTATTPDAASTSPQMNINNDVQQPSRPPVETIMVHKPYSQFLIASPANQETIQNQPTLNVVIFAKPQLQEGDTIQLYLDGLPIGKQLPTTEFVLTAPDRGSHTLLAKIFDKNNQLITTSSANTIYVHQAHL